MFPRLLSSLIPGLDQQDQQTPTIQQGPAPVAPQNAEQSAPNDGFSGLLASLFGNSQPGTPGGPMSDLQIPGNQAVSQLMGGAASAIPDIPEMPGPIGGALEQLTGGGSDSAQQEEGQESGRWGWLSSLFGG